METYLKQVKDRWNQTSDAEWYQALRTEEKISQLVREPASAFHPAVYELVKKYVLDVQGKKILLPSSGDNHAAFAFALMGADVTSADISERQLEHAQQIAGNLKLRMHFVCDDTMQLSKLEDTQFDLVYTSNGTHSWITDLEAMYRNISRVLKPKGFSLMYDVHPFGRPFTGEPWKNPEIIKPYDKTMPDCHWRVSDLVNAMTGAQLSIKEMRELQAVDDSFWFSHAKLTTRSKEEIENINNWEKNPMAALPAWISILSQKVM